MENWQLFENSAFSLRFRYPRRTESGEPVKRRDTEQDHIFRVHILAPKSREVYFEVTRFESLSAKAEYQQHKKTLPQQFQSLKISELRETVFVSHPAFEYSFGWDQGNRTVLLIEDGEVTYRILYNPRFPVNLQILSTVEWTALQ